MGKLIALYRLVIRSGKFVLPVVLLLIRLAWGWELFESGRGHLMHIEQTVEAFRGWGVPAPEMSVRVSGTFEMVGGLLWMAGLGTRFISLPLFFNFCVAYATASRDNVLQLFHSGADFDKITDDSAFPFLVTSLLLFALGPGLISIDAILKRTVFAKWNSHPKLPPAS